MPFFKAPDGTELAYRTVGRGAPLVCLAGGPFRDAAYLGDLGGLSAFRRLVLLDLRGTGRSATPDDPASYRCDRLVADVEGLRVHLGLDTLDLLAHSAAANLAMRYAERHPQRIGRLLLITPGTDAAGVVVTVADRRELLPLRAGEPWFEAASAAFDAVATGTATEDDWQALAPLTYGRWDAQTQAHRAAQASQWNERAAQVFGCEGDLDPEATRAGLAALPAPVLVLAGELDLATPPGVVARVAELCANGVTVVQPGAGHYPWLDDAGAFTATVTAFLS
ncbi:alpha/beta hydrolase [Kitasatospora sp. RB6PN24]|uniref:alpha/beta fold hydrolase n=1 Tax=Kitasatospora humi TaxID=2893891 RepID=UPI001E41F95C|nr:alpha/beta hydrolase [Kitasatospora humi]MCC9307916.1 alpha/beta hydrolase [Kitasatospora humi]